MSYNSNTIVTNTPTNKKPRSKIDFGWVKNHSSSMHGRLTPNFIMPVYPGDTFNMKDFRAFCRSDKSVVVPLDDIYFDQFFFFVPFRILDNSFKKMLGDKDPYDTTIYEAKQIKISLSCDTSNDEVFLNYLPFYLGYTWDSLDSAVYNSSSDPVVFDHVCAYPLMAYWCIWNNFFRDENLDASIDFSSILSSVEDFLVGDDLSTLSSLDNYYLAPMKVNKLHDALTSGLTSPQKSPDGNPVTLFLGASAPVYVEGPSDLTSSESITNIDLGIAATAADGKKSKTFTKGGSALAANQLKAYADLSEATAVDVNALRLAFSIQSLYEAKSRYGSRYIEYLRGIWSVVAPDIMLDRPEYLGGMRTTLNNIPVLGTATNLGEFSGYSATLMSGGTFEKTFLEYGYVIGLHVCRVKHEYPQGKDTNIWNLKTELDLYNPKLAEIGYQGYSKSLIFNNPILGTDDSIFNYNEAWMLERAKLNRASGVFSPMLSSAFASFRTYWCYADFYSTTPTFNADWLKEDVSNVKRTLSGSVIPQTADYSHQYIWDFRFHPVVTRIIPVYSVPAQLGGRW